MAWRGSWSYSKHGGSTRTLKNIAGNLSFPIGNTSTCFHGGTSQRCFVRLLQSQDELVKPTLKRNRLLLGFGDGNPDTPILDENIFPNINYVQVSPLKKTSPKNSGEF